MKPKKKNPAAQALGRIKSEKRAAASRENGKLGGPRPRYEINALLFRQSKMWWLIKHWRDHSGGREISAGPFKTADEAREYAERKGWGVRRAPGCDE